jgi:hypothetical protein
MPHAVITMDAEKSCIGHHGAFGIVWPTMVKIRKLFRLNQGEARE